MQVRTSLNGASSLDVRIAGPFWTRFLLELFGNSAYFPIVNILLELLRAPSPLAFFRAVDPYILLGVSVVQAYLLTRWAGDVPLRRLVGNLTGPALYTLIEGAFEGFGPFFAGPHHLAYWAFALAIGLFQALHRGTDRPWNGLFLILENVTRTGVLFIMYAIFEITMAVHPVFNFRAFFADRSHRFIALTVLFVGLNAGLAALTSERYLALLRETSEKLRTYSEWLLGRTLLEQAFRDPEGLSRSRRERTILFMDVRGFTAWSETRPPEAVVGFLDRYYQIAEEILCRYQAIKFKLSADEVMAIFSRPQEGVAAARELVKQIQGVLTAEGLGVGIGVHVGPVVEGILGGQSVRQYDVIGDAVNTAKRIEGAAEAGEVLISEAVYRQVPEAPVGPRRTIAVKGKGEPLAVYPLEE